MLTWETLNWALTSTNCLNHCTSQLFGYCFYPLQAQVLPPFFITQHTIFQGLLTPSGSIHPAQPPVAQHPPKYPPKAYTHSQRTPTDHPRQKFNKLICFPGPTPPFLLLPAFPSKAVPRRVLFALCSLLRQGRTARPLAYGNCKAQILTKF